MIDNETYELFANDPSKFRESLILDVDGVAERFGDVIEDFQDKDFRAMDAGLLYCLGRIDQQPKMRAYLERPRGHSKTTDLAIVVTYLLTFAPRALRGYCYAADRDQAKLLHDSITRVIKLNPWIGEILKVTQGLVTNTANQHPGFGATLKIETSDVASSYGILPDAIIADEFCHWAGDGSLWHSLISSAAKRSKCLLVSISNAGFIDSWQWNAREAIRTSDDWYFSSLDGVKASWMSEAVLEEQRKLLPEVAYQRLWCNRWSAGGGDLLTQEDIERAFNQDLNPMSGREAGYSFIGGVDLGLTRDSSAICVLGVRDSDQQGAGFIRLAYHKLWSPKRGSKVNLQQVEDELVSLHKRFDFQKLCFDPWQASHMSQRLAHRDIPCEDMPQVGSTLMKLASTTIEAFNDGRVQCYECPPLKRDLHKARIEEKSYGFRIVSPRDEHGHSDLLSAFCFALLGAHQYAEDPVIYAGAPREDSFEPYSFESRTMKARLAWSAGIHPAEAFPLEFEGD